MFQPRNTKLAPLAATLLLAACSGTTSDGSGANVFAILSVTQDLNLDPHGFTTVIEFAGDVTGLVDASMFAGSEGESPVGFQLDGSTVTIVWDERLSPNDELTFDDLQGNASSFDSIDATDESAPTFTVAGTQVAGLGGDSLTITFSGAYLLPDEVEDAARWALFVDDQELDLAGSVFSLDENTQIASVDLGDAANLHAAFELSAVDLHSVADAALDPGRVVGAAAGDSSAPALTAVAQNLGQDAFGRVIDFAFDEDVDPLFAADTSLYVAGFPILPISAAIAAPDTVRVTYSAPVIPGFQTIDVGAVPDCAGNTTLPATENVAAGATIANAIELAEATTVENSGGDALEIVFSQAFESESAEDFTHWTLESPAGTFHDLSSASFAYDWTTSTLSLGIEQDLRNGDDFELASTGVLEIDGELTAGLAASGIVAGETNLPTIATVVQNRLLDPSGATVDVTLSEDLDETSAETAGNWSTDGMHVLLSATLQGNLRTVRVVFDTTVLPGAFQLVTGGIEDLAGNLSAPASSAVDSNDVLAPGYGGAIAQAPEGEADYVELSFTDDMWPADVEDAQNWSIESPLGTPFDLANALVDYDEVTRVARLSLDDALGPWFQARDDFEVALANMRDLGANVVPAGSLSGTVDAEWSYPRVISAYDLSANTTQVGLRFSEAMQDLDDLLSGVVEYVYRDAASTVIGTAGAVALDADQHGVVLTFGFTVDDTGSLDVRGPADLAGNALFTEISFPIEPEDSLEPGIDAGTTAGTTAAGDDNDSIAITFDRGVDPGIAALSSFVIEDGPFATIDFSGAAIAFDGFATVTISNLPDGFGNGVYNSTFNLKVLEAMSVQGVALSSEINHAVVFTGDTTPPAISSARVDPVDSDSLILILDEPVLSLAEGGSAAIGGNGALSIQEIDARVYRLGFAPGIVAVGNTLDLVVEDRADNVGISSQAIAGPDSGSPAVSSVSAVAVEGFGGDLVQVTFDEPVDQSSASDWNNYQASDAAGPIDLSLATFSYAALEQRVTIALPAGRDLDTSAGAQLSLQVAGVSDVAGNAMAVPANLLETMVGDLVAVGSFEAFVNYRADPAGTTIDVQFSEDVDEAFAGDVLQWTTAGAATVSSTQMLRPDIVRLGLSLPMGAGDNLFLAAGLPDAAGNQTAAVLAGDPTE